METCVQSRTSGSSGRGSGVGTVRQVPTSSPLTRKGASNFPRFGASVYSGDGRQAVQYRLPDRPRARPPIEQVLEHGHRSQIDHASRAGREGRGRKSIDRLIEQTRAAIAHAHRSRPGSAIAAVFAGAGCAGGDGSVLIVAIWRCNDPRDAARLMRTRFANDRAVAVLVLFVCIATASCGESGFAPMLVLASQMEGTLVDKDLSCPKRSRRANVGVGFER
jgi:hypothetical protein